MHEVVLYTKAGCCLCDTAKEQILAVRSRVPFGFREVDITSDPELFEEHKFDIPVVEVDGRRAFKHRVDPRALLARLQT
jgi:hypothetical protein